MPKWRWKQKPATTDGHGQDRDSDHLALARESLRNLIHDARLPAGVRESLSHDYDAVQGMLDKLEHGHIHLAVFGRVEHALGRSLVLTLTKHGELVPEAAAKDFEEGISEHIEAGVRRVAKMALETKTGDD